MFIGELSKEDERIISEIMYNHSCFTVVQNEIHFIVNNEQHIIVVGYQRKPLNRIFYDGAERETILKPCVIINLDGMKISIFRYGYMYLNITIGNLDTSHILLIKNEIAHEFYNFIVNKINGKTNY